MVTRIGIGFTYRRKIVHTHTHTQIHTVLRFNFNYIDKVVVPVYVGRYISKTETKNKEYCMYIYYV